MVLFFGNPFGLSIPSTAIPGVGSGNENTSIGRPSLSRCQCPCVGFGTFSSSQTRANSAYVVSSSSATFFSGAIQIFSYSSCREILLDCSLIAELRLSLSSMPFQVEKCSYYCRIVRNPVLHVYTNFLYIHAVRIQAKTATDSLFEIAEGQQGYFTAKQAADAGYQLGSQAHHAKSGNWVRVERGIYRLARFSQSSEEQLVIYTLWSRNRAGEPEGVYSHQTALSIHELSDVNPAKLHMTVPSAFRRNAETPKILVLHRASIDEEDVE